MIIQAEAMHAFPAVTDDNVQCARCQKPILDRFVFNVLERSWHSLCVQCAVCGCTLAEKCFARDGQLYCKDDFYRLVGHVSGWVREWVVVTRRVLINILE